MKQWLAFIAGMVMVGCVPQEQEKERASQPIVSTEEQLMESGEHLGDTSNDITNEFENMVNFLNTETDDLEILLEQTNDPEIVEELRKRITSLREKAAMFGVRSEAMQREANRASDTANDRSIDE